MTADMAPRSPRARIWTWLKRIGFGILALLLLLVLLGAVYEMLARRDAEKRFPPPGKLVDIGGRRIHLDCRGTGAPSVVFESGLGSGGSVDWTLVHGRIAETTRACAYDRAGIMWSDPKAAPQDGAAVADDLHATLKAAGIDGPLVLVGHSIGGPYVTTYTGKYGDQVAGLVLVDPSHPDQIKRLGDAVNANVHPGQYAGFMKTLSALSWTGGVRLLLSGPGAPKLPAEANAKIAAYGPRSIAGSITELDGFDRTLAQAGRAHAFGNRPLIVLTAMAPFEPGQLKALNLKPEDGARFKQVWKALGAEQAGWSTGGRQQIVPDAGHYIQIDRPDLVIAAVNEVVGRVRGGRAGRN